MLASRVRQSIQGPGPTSFPLIADVPNGFSSVVIAFGSGSGHSGIFTIKHEGGTWSVVEGYATSGSPDTFTLTRTLRNSLGTAGNVTWPPGNMTIFCGECADLLAPLAQCPTTAGTASAYTLAYTPAPLALPSNVVLRLKFHAANTGAATLAINALGALPIVQPDGSALYAGYIKADTIGVLMYDHADTRFVLLTPSDRPPAASTAWVSFDSAGAVLGSYNVSSVTRTGTGAYTVNFTTALASANYAAVASCGADGSGNHLIPLVGGYGTTSVTVLTARRSDGVSADPLRTSLTCFGG